MLLKKIKNAWRHFFEQKIAMVIEYRPENDCDFDLKTQEFKCSGSSILMRSSANSSGADALSHNKTRLGKEEITRSRSYSVINPKDTTDHKTNRDRSYTTTTPQTCNVDSLRNIKLKSEQHRHFLETKSHEISNTTENFLIFCNIGEYWETHLQHYLVCVVDQQEVALFCFIQLNNWFERLSTIKALLVSTGIEKNIQVSKKLVDAETIKKDTESEPISLLTKFEPTWGMVIKEQNSVM